ncbi:ABC transporter substrate-binding protein [Leptospira sp. 2 VSF19]|uniref:histidine kinase n=1 Tax=Leptospira soteropolitanensis TaxID=2950025 RepID=A0AAW5VNH6_9LEPT|nr:ABC transporter substrate-binding protein [Leptospira soteropolitanensis]MCW7494291.1 ABC transporter substrate-binding protein [Leptospira soteropolitanensis]MCW7502000.1 ABC transporter substrate-binding protein [Leptospira soteropolitanensis]MCW7524137.1 ABC transporter substrate-binding protein [Leptospira soteropolitanensis]MCW7528002.1 ABC transporter substrate-binding protein [Leptospira soteropolitanensis]MCW7531856.1 ABC transporter substrate-binding protein [Leptospira soteropolit
MHGRASKKIFFFFFSLLCLSHSPVFGIEKVTLHLKWFHQFQFAGYYTALEKGFYRDVGLDVEILESTVGIKGIHEKVIQSTGQYGVGSNELIQERFAGKPVVVLAVIFQHSPSVLYFKKTSNIQSIHDLAGKRVMLTPRMDEIVAYLKKEGIGPSDLQLLEHGFNPNDLIQGKVDAYSGYATTQAYDFKKAGFPYIAYSPRVAGIDFYGDNLFTSEAEIREHPERVKAFREASLRGWQYAMAHQSEIVDLIYEKYSKRNPKERLLFEAEQMTPLIQPVLVEMGYMNPGRWKHINEVYSELGMLPKNIDLKGFIYDPNPKVNYDWIYYAFGFIVVSFLIIWLVQWRRLNKQYSENLKKQVEVRTEELKHSNEYLQVLNQSLLNTLKELTEAQERLLASEKLAVLGQLSAGMAHELNTPLGAIVSSNQSITDFLNKIKNVIESIIGFNKEDSLRFHKLLEQSLKNNIFLEGKEERSIKKELAIKYSNSKKMDLYGKHMQLVVETGAFRLGDGLNEILESENSLQILETVANIFAAYRSNQIISVASEKATHVIKALKSYLVSEKDILSGDTAVDLIFEIETILSLYHHKLTKVNVLKKYLTDKKCKGSRDKLNQVWINLLNNALQAMGYVGTLEIKIQEVESWIKVSITDSGTGISDSIKNKIFDPFFTTKPAGEGMGLGLDICKKIILQMGGKIELEDVPNGACFSVWLPMA